MTWEQEKAQSVAILDRYKDRISQESYDRILYAIGIHAIEDMFADEEDIKNLIRVENGEIAGDELINEYKRKWGAT
jgi:hypothetical protein